jgi:ParB family chromosome partitioning protein
VREAVSDEAADRMTGMKKQAMAEAAEQLVVATGWLPPLLRTERPAWLEPPQAEGDADAVVDAPEAAEAEPAEAHADEAAATGTAQASEPDAGEPAPAENADAAEDVRAFHDAAE